MGYFDEAQADIKTTRVKLRSNPKYWVDVQVGVRWGESKHAISVDKEGGVDLVTSADKLLRQLIKDWNLTDKDGNKAPIDEEHIDMLRPEDAMALIDAAGATSEQAEDAKKN